MATTRNKRIHPAIPLLIAACFWSVPAEAQYSGGSGSAQDPYQIATAADLIALGGKPNDYHKQFILTADIDLDPNLPGGRVFTDAVVAPLHYGGIGRFRPSLFTGVFDGQNHTISHLTMAEGGALGLFGGLGSGAVLINLRLEAVDIRGVGIGSLVSHNEGSVANCYSTGVVSSSGSAGGLVEDNRGDISNSCSIAIITGSSEVGGLVGDNTGTIVNSYARGSVSGDRLVGGLVGSNGHIQTRDVYYEAPGEIVNSYSSGAVTGTSDVGGLVGRHIIGPVFSSFWDVQTSGQTTSAAGVGKTTAQMEDIQAYLDAGWDLVGEVRNGTSDLWQMPPEIGYPIQSVFLGYTPSQLKGSGTPDDPYLIYDAIELGAVVHYSPYAHYRLAASIDLSGIRWATAVVPRMGGTFEGDGHTISHLTINGGSHLGLFGSVRSGAQVKDLGVVDVSITGSGDYVTGLAATNGGTLTGCYSTGAVSSGGTGRCSYVGGLIGSNSGSVAQCHSTAAVSGASSHAGGLVGQNGGVLTECYSTGAVDITGSDVGGLAGSNGGTVAQCYSIGVVGSTGWSVGGLVGSNYVGGVVIRCYGAGRVSGTSHVGGLVGWNVSRVSQCYSIGAVSGSKSVGGLVGGAGSSNVDACFWDVETSGQAISAGGMGKTTAQMQMAGTFVEAGWDFLGETINGVEDIWWILEGKDYPRLVWELQ